MVYGQFSLYKQNIFSWLFSFVIIYSKRCMYNSSKHTFGKQDKPNICLESYHIHIERNQNNTSLPLWKTLIIYLITHMYNSCAADDFGVRLTIWFAIKLLFNWYYEKKMIKS